MSNVNAETLMYERIDTVAAKLEKTEPGTPEHKALAEEFTALMDRAIETDKVDRDSEEKAATRKDEKKDRIVKNILSAVGIALPLLVTVWGTKTSLKFEETGTVTTQAGRTFIQRLFSKK